MINFQPLKLENKAEYERYLMSGSERGCEYSFANLFMWGRQRGTVVHDQLVLFSQFNRRSVYPYPAGTADKKAAIEEIIQDAHTRGIPCRLTGLTQTHCQELEGLFPGRFRIHCDRDGFDYVYTIDDLADLKGKRYQKKRNHLNRFLQTNPDYSVRPLDTDTLPKAQAMVEDWYTRRLQENPDSDFHMESNALRKAFENREMLDMEGMILELEGQVVAVTMGSRLNAETFDIHFEKARHDIDGAYAAINWEFARYLRKKYPDVRYLNREDDMGLEGLRKAKLSYYPHHMVEKYWACLLEDGYVY